MLVHRTEIASDVTSGFAMQLLRDHLGQHVYPVHRLDRPTSGVLLFALSSESAKAIKELFDLRQIKKNYLAVVRGFLKKPKLTLELPLRKWEGTIVQDAVTDFETLQQVVLDKKVDRFPQSWYSLIQASPLTGRTHQIRRHLAKLNNPIIGDKKHGDNVQNHFFENDFNIHSLLPHARELSFTHPVTKEQIHIEARLPDDFNKVLTEFNWSV